MYVSSYYKENEYFSITKCACNKIVIKLSYLHDVLIGATTVTVREVCLVSKKRTWKKISLFVWFFPVTVVLQYNTVTFTLRVYVLRI